ncbi:cytochrome c biogenesis protein CcdA [Candidatus Omnitrophota bacterium]
MNLSGSPLDFIWVFLAGILSSFSPCIYPLLPITVAHVGASSAGSRFKGFSLSLVYVLGISVTYALLGVAAVATGTIFGKFSSQPLVRIIAGLIIIFFGFFLWRGQGFRIAFLKQPVRKGRGSYLSSFFLGITSGLVIGPCTAPVVGSILVFVAAEKNFFYGAFLLFTFAYGMGLVLILAGTFSSILTKLPKAGRWTEVTMKVFAVILIIAGFYFAVTGAINLSYAQDTQQASPLAPDFTLEDLDANKVTLSQFQDNKSVVLFFWTTWCPYCRSELLKLNQIYPETILEDIEILAINIEESRAKVRAFLKRYSLDLRVLLDSDARVAYSYSLVGVPTFVLINKQGEVVFLDNRFPADTYRSLLAE